MGCNGCVHYEICDYWEKEAYPNDHKDFDKYTCKYFLAKDLFIKLPCAVGQTIYYIDHYRDCIETDTVKFFTVTKSGINVILQYHNQKFWDYQEWGKTVFLSEGEAQEAFKER
jgi:hypothetical protein